MLVSDITVHSDSEGDLIILLVYLTSHTVHFWNQGASLMCEIRY
jgi:hypothetical protein